MTTHPLPPVRVQRVALAGLVLAVVPGLAACDTPTRMKLPALVAVVARVEGGAYASLLVDLHAPRRRPTIRVREGVSVFDGRRLLEMRVVARETEATTHRDLLVQDLLTGAEIVVRAAPGTEGTNDVQVMSVGDRTLLLRFFAPGWDRWFEVDLDDGEVRESPPQEDPARFVQLGPGRGFSVYTEAGRLMLKLPHDEENESIPLLDGVEGVVSVDWIPDEHFPMEVQEALDAQFKSTGSLVALARTCRVDGDLTDWTGDVALPVGTASQVLEGASAWSGERDASFAVAVRVTPSALCTAVRLRDEAIVPGEDAIEIHVGGQRFDYPLPLFPVERQDKGARAAFTDRVAFGMGMEACFDGELWESDREFVPFRVLFRDVDPGASTTTVLATAPEVPWPSLAGVRLPPRQGRGGTR